MKSLTLYIVFAFLTGFTATRDLPLMAGGCSSHINKSAEIKCAEDDIKCQTEKAEKNEINKAIRS